MRKQDVAYSVLGPLEVRVNGVPVPVGSSRQQIILACMLLERGHVVQADRFIDALWDGEPPATAWVQVQIGISKLRSRLSNLELPNAIVTHEAGYLVQVPEDCLDLVQFRHLVGRAREAARAQRPEEAADQLRSALALWRGDALAGLPGRWIRAAASRLDEERLAAVEERVELEIAMGGHREVIGELRELTAAYPLRERFHGQLMRALYRDGRQAEALEAYRTAQRVLVEEHGLDPGDELRALERAILERALATGDGVPGHGRLQAAEEAVPHQLPAAPRGCVGRQEDITAIQQRLTGNGPSGGAVVVISGPPGVGKTALALHCAHQLANRFPDGHLYARLRDSDARPVPAERLLDQFLRGLGIPPAGLPAELDELAAMFRSRIAGRRILIVLDDAAAAWQIEPLVSEYGGTLIVTSRGTLPGLRGVDRFDLGVLEPRMSLQLLATVIGQERVQAEPAAAAAVARICGHLPLALHIAAAKLEVRPHWTIAQLVDRLSDEGRRLDELSLAGTAVRASLQVSFETLDPPARRLLPLLGGLGTSDFAAWVSGPLLDMDVDQGTDVLEQLVEARLVDVLGGAGHRTRYRLHELVGTFARQTLAAATPAAERHQAQVRLLRCWAFLVDHAHRREYGGDFTIVRSTAQRWPLPNKVVSELMADPIGWFEEERTNLLSAVRRAAELGFQEICADLAVGSVTLFETRAHLSDWRESHEVALEAARRHDDPRSEAAVRCSRAGLALAEHRLDDAVSHLESALGWFVHADHRHGRGLALRSLAVVDRLRGHPARARQRYEAALTDLREAGDRAAEAQVLTNLAQIDLDDGRLDEAHKLLRQALAICTGIGERRGEAQVRFRLGELYLARGELTEAEAELEAVWTAVDHTGDLVGKTYALLGLGAARLAHDDLDGAEKVLAEALELAQRARSRLLEGRARLAMAQLRQRQGRSATAVDDLNRAEAIFTAIAVDAWREQVEQLRVSLTSHA